MDAKLFSLPSPWEQHFKGNGTHRFSINKGLQVNLTTASPKLVIDNPLPAGTVCGVVYINRGRIRIGIVDPLPGSVSQGLIFRKGEAFFLSSVKTLTEVSIFLDSTTEANGHGMPNVMQDTSCTLAEVCILYLKHAPVP